MAGSGIGRILREALKRLMESRAPRAAAEGLDEDAISQLRNMNLDRSNADEIGAMFDDAGNMVSPEEYLGRPLTPDHIWNDPRFNHRLAMTSDLEGVQPPVDRFRIAGERVEAGLPRGNANDLDAWRVDRAAMMPDLLRRQRTIDGSYGGARPDNTTSMNEIIEAGRDPRMSAALPEALGEYLGHFGAGGSAQHAPLMGAALTAGVGGGLTLREALRNQWSA